MEIDMSKVLLVEDSRVLVKAITDELQAAGYQVVHTPEGPAALDLHRQHQPDLVILDWGLPGLDGLEVLRRLRQVAGTPVLMLTGRGEEADRVLGLEVGADDYLTKPFGMRELMARVRAVLRRAELARQAPPPERAAGDAPLQSGSLLLDPPAHRATLAGQVLRLTRTEFLLLHLLLRHSGRAFSRNELLDAVWGHDYVEGDRAVDNAVLRLRRKLGALGEALETVWGVGYRWQEKA
jgi:DNA-binding response OmpR family regulator